MNNEKVKTYSNARYRMGAEFLTFCRMFDKLNKKYFVKSSIFYCRKEIFDNVIKFIKNNNYIQYFTNNLYDNNIINITNSPAHWLERLFGII